MTTLRIFLSRLRGLFLKRKLEGEMADEFQAHLEMQIEDHLRHGMNPEEARHLALRKFSGWSKSEEIDEWTTTRSGVCLAHLFEDFVAK